MTALLLDPTYRFEYWLTSQNATSSMTLANITVLWSLAAASSTADGGGAAGNTSTIRGCSCIRALLPGGVSFGSASCMLVWCRPSNDIFSEIMSSMSDLDQCCSNTGVNDFGVIWLLCLASPAKWSKFDMQMGNLSSGADAIMLENHC